MHTCSVCVCGIALFPFFLSLLFYYSKNITLAHLPHVSVIMAEIYNKQKKSLEYISLIDLNL